MAFDVAKMNASTAIGLTALTLLLTHCANVSDSQTNRFSPSPRIAEILSWPDEGGSIYYQARRSDGFDYRNNLTKAAGGDVTALSGLFAYTRTNHLMGEGSESHIMVLGELLKQWGDQDYSRVLEHESPPVIREVAQSLAGFWGHSGWPNGMYPATENLCAHGTEASRARTTPTTRPVSMISRNYNHNPMIDARSR